MSETERILVCDLRAQVAARRCEFDAAIARVLDRGWFVLGEELRQFEIEFAQFVDTSFAVGVASGTDAIALALRAVGVKPGDTVLTAANSAVPTATGIEQAGAIPFFGDVDPEFGLLDPNSVAEAIERHTIAAIVPVHLYGRCCSMDKILELARRRNIPVVEDAAQAHGASYRGQSAGSLADLACFSFYPSKNLGTFGDGGAVTGSEGRFEVNLRHLRNYGQEDRYHHVVKGVNSRLDELAAAILRTKLPYLREWNARRQQIAKQYRRAFANLPLALAGEAEDRPSVEHLFVVRVARRDAFRAALEKRGIATEVHYPIPIYLQPSYSELGQGPGSCPVAEARAGQICSVPIYPEMTDTQVDRVIDAVTHALEGEPEPEEIAL